MPVAPNTFSVAINPSGSFAYASTLLANNVSVISTATNTVVATIPVGSNPGSIAFVTKDPIGSLIAEVQALVTAGTLTQNQADALINKLDQAVAKLAQDKSGPACNQLGAFINEVNAFINNGSLTQAQGQSLINAVNAFRTGLGCP